MKQKPKQELVGHLAEAQEHLKELKEWWLKNRDAVEAAEKQKKKDKKAKLQAGGAGNW